LKEGNKPDIVCRSSCT